MTKTSFMVSTASIGLLLIGIGCNSTQEPVAESPKPEASVAQAAPQPTEPTAQAVQDVLNQRCMPCHATGNPKEGLAMDSIDGLLKGGEHGPVVVAGDAANSLVVQRMRGLGGKKKMPPMGDPATEDEIKTVEAWINAGAKK